MRAVAKWPPRIVAHPGRCGGQPTVGESRIPAELVAGVMWAHGMGEAEQHWEPYVDRYGVLAACWYQARYGTRTWRKRWADWLKIADDELWHSTRDRWDNCPDPPMLNGGSAPHPTTQPDQKSEPAERGRDTTTTKYGAL